MSDKVKMATVVASWCSGITVSSSGVFSHVASEHQDIHTFRSNLFV